MLDLAGHDHLVDAFRFKKPEHLTQLADAHPGETIGEAFNFGISLLSNCRDGHGRACAFRSLKHEKRKLTVACD
jgi:hypothetical protein